MKLLNHSIKARVLWLLASCLALLVSLPVPGFQTQTTRKETSNVTRWEHTDTDIGLRRRLEVRGKAEFTDDYTDIQSVSDNGYVIVEEQRDGQSYRYEVRASGGQLTRLFYLNGAARSLDETSRAWLAKMVLDAVRQGGIDTEKRVSRILAQRGVAGVLVEIALIEGDWAKRNYYEQLIKQANLDATALRDVLRQVARDISSDYEQAQLLTAVAPMLTGKDAAIQPYFDAVATIKSDYERSRVLKTILKQGTPSRALLVLVASATKSIHSDYEKAGVLKRVAAVYLDEPSLRELFFQTVATVGSDYERRGVLTALVKTKNQSEEVLRLLLDAAAAISSDYEKATFLVDVSNTYMGDTRLKSAFLKAAESIKSDYERGRVLSTLLKNKQIG